PSGAAHSNGACGATVTGLPPPFLCRDGDRDPKRRVRTHATNPRFGCGSGGACPTVLPGPPIKRNSKHLTTVKKRNPISSDRGLLGIRTPSTLALNSVNDGRAPWRRCRRSKGCEEVRRK